MNGYELCTRMLRVPILCPAIAHIYSRILQKPSFCNSKKQNINSTRKQKLKISSYNIQL